MSDTTSPLKHTGYGQHTHTMGGSGSYNKYGEQTGLSQLLGGSQGGGGLFRGLFKGGGGGNFLGKLGGLFRGEGGEDGGGLLGDMSAVGKMQMASGIGGILQGVVGSRKRRDEQREAKTEYDKQRKAYQALDTSNLYANVQNQYANLENPFEDLTINQQQAQFEAQQGAQSRANIMQGLQGAAGGSGIAGLAQAVANQSQLATQKAAASIGLQESQQQRLMAQQASRMQMAERGGEAQAERMRLKGAEQARDLDWQKQEMELGFAMQEKARADQARQEANSALWGGIGSLATTALTGGFDKLFKGSEG